MKISFLAGLFMCCELASDLQIPQYKTAAECKRSACKRAVYRITYPVRQLVSSLCLIPPQWTLAAAGNTWTALENRQCNLAAKLALSVTSGVCALVASLTIGIVFTVTVGLVLSIGKAICEPGIDELDTLLERGFDFGVAKVMHMV